MAWLIGLEFNDEVIRTRKILPVFNLRCACCYYSRAGYVVKTKHGVDTLFCRMCVVTTFGDKLRYGESYE